MRRLGLRVSALGVLLALAVGAAGLVAAPAQGAASTLLTEDQVRSSMLSLKAIRAVSRVGYPVTADELVCHTAPNGRGTTVHYCYYTKMIASGAYNAGKPWPSHVDIIAFQSPKEARRYIREMTAGKPATARLTATTTTLVAYEKTLPIPTPVSPLGEPGPTVSVFKARGANVAYTVCADPKAVTSRALVRCATSLAEAQLDKIK